MNLALESPSSEAKLLISISQLRKREMKIIKRLAEYATHKSKLDNTVGFFSVMSLLR